MNTQGAAWSGLIIGLFVVVAILALSPVFFKDIVHAGEVTTGVLSCGGAFNGSCMPRCGRGMTEYTVSKNDGSCPPEEDNPETSETDITTKPDQLSFISNEEYQNKHYWDERTWKTCCINDPLAGG